MALKLREVEIFRPYADEFPDDLFTAAGMDEARLEDLAAAEYVRIAKLGGAIVGAYALGRVDALAYELLAVVVAEASRRQGLGRWLVGHAIGVAESKGGRQVFVPQSGGTRMFERIGFVADGDGLRYDLVPE